MKTTFMRQFLLTASLVLVSIVLIFAASQPMLESYLLRVTGSSLQASAESVANFAAAYATSGDLQDNWDVRIALDFAAGLAETDALVTDEDGVVILCSCGQLPCPHLGRTLPEELLQAVAAQGEVTRRGTLTGIYDDARYQVAVPIVSASGETGGIVVVSTQLTLVKQLLSKTLSIYVGCALVVLLLAVVACSVMASRLTQPLRDMAQAAARFGRGELDLRVPTGGHNTREVDELARSFNAMAENLAQSDRRRSEFVANVSHELRTPMTTIAGFMDGMLDGTIPPEEHRKYMQAVSDEVRRLSRLVRSMLEVSRLRAQDREEQNWQVFDLAEQLGQTLISYEQRINAKNLQVEVNLPEEGMKVLAPQDPVAQVVRNLLDNAVKFAAEGGVLALSLTREGDKAVVTVSDTGQTIPPDELPLIFDRFHKADKSRSQDREGVGLGLYIVHTILDSLGEDISCQSGDGRTSFRFTLPLA